METDSSSPVGGNGAGVEKMFRSEMLVRLTTKLEEEALQVPSDTLSVPSSLDRYEMSELVNKLLSHDTPIPFDFLVTIKSRDEEDTSPTTNTEQNKEEEGANAAAASKEVFLRSTLAALRNQYNLSSESVVFIRYVLALPPFVLEKEQTQSTEDWVSCVRLAGGKKDSRVLVSDFSGTLKVYDADSLDLVRENKVADSITCFELVPASGFMQRKDDGRHDVVHIALGDQDGTVRFGSVNMRTGEFVLCAETEETIASTPTAFQQGIEAMAVSKKAQLLATGGWDFQTVRLWVTEDCFQPLRLGKEKEHGTASSASKKRVMDDDDDTSAVFARPDFLLKLRGKSHGCTTALIFLSEIHLAVGCQDSSLFIFDIASAKPLTQVSVGSKAVCRMDFHFDEKLLAIAHEDGGVSFWDCDISKSSGSATTSEAEEEPKVVLSERYSALQQSHSGMVSALLWGDNVLSSEEPRNNTSHQSSFRLLSSGLDSTLRVCDPRSPSMPLQVIAVTGSSARGEKKIPVKITTLSCRHHVDGGMDLYSGASDGRLRKHVARMKGAAL